MHIYDVIKKNMKGIVMKDEMLKNHTSMRVGGPCDVFVVPDSKKEFLWLFRFLQKEGVRFFIMGNGTNVIFDDNGFRGVVIKTTKCFNNIDVEDNEVLSGSGVDLMKLIILSARLGLSCLENLYGIPGTVGGAIWMNAGAFGREIKDCIKEVEFINISGNRKQINSGFSYRKSAFKKGDVIVEARFIFTRRKKSDIMHDIENIKKKREQKQPLDMPSAGSIFKNPQRGFAGEIIDRLGLKGFAYGDAMISTKHANFIVNRGNATAKDIKELVHKVKETVKKEEGVDLKLEVEFVPEN